MSLNPSNNESDELVELLGNWSQHRTGLSVPGLSEQVHLRRHRQQMRRRQFAAVSIVVLGIAGSWATMQFNTTKTNVMIPKERDGTIATLPSHPAPLETKAEVARLQSELARLAQEMKIARLEIELSTQSTAVGQLEEKIADAAFEFERDEVRNAIALEWSRHQAGL